MSFSETARTRITRLIKIMEKVPLEHFAMRSWFSHYGDHPIKVNKKGNVTKTTLKDCNTTACAAGWAATDPYFQKLGMTLNPVVGLSINGVNGRNLDLWENLAKVFDINMFQTEHLFTGKNSYTPAEWCNVARLMLESDGNVRGRYDDRYDV